MGVALVTKQIVSTAEGDKGDAILAVYIISKGIPPIDIQHFMGFMIVQKLLYSICTASS